VLIVYLIRGRILIVSMIRGRTESLSVFFDIDVKGGEKVWSGCYSWRSKQNSVAFQGCHQCQRGILLACLKSVLVIDGKNNNDEDEKSHKR
jgi:hypothetical protein